MFSTSPFEPARRGVLLFSANRSTLGDDHANVLTNAAYELPALGAILVPAELAAGGNKMLAATGTGPTSYSQAGQVSIGGSPAVTTRYAASSYMGALWFNVAPSGADLALLHDRAKRLIAKDSVELAAVA